MNQATQGREIVVTRRAEHSVYKRQLRSGVSVGGGPPGSAVTERRLGEFKSGGERETPEKTILPAASSGTIPTCENPEVPRPGIEPGSPRWEAGSLTAQPPLPLICLEAILLVRVRGDQRGRPSNRCSIGQWMETPVSCKYGLADSDMRQRRSSTTTMSRPPRASASLRVVACIGTGRTMKNWNNILEYPRTHDVTMLA
ncbi:hypothetical protein PR048_029236 [Dryococelus australis]|uniref:Uncharacterized protein n=1 Tax=Dryococelus australis TaxID=614101 RepID=A0ABQ9GCV8_9NEOP|nr:hypothetical protein PR048_029236 [Dryococelus australis]